MTLETLLPAIPVSNSSKIQFSVFLNSMKIACVQNSGEILPLKKTENSRTVISVLLHSTESTLYFVNVKIIFMKSMTMKPYFPKFRNTYCTNSLVLVLNEVFQYSSPFLRIHKKKMSAKTNYMAPRPL